MKTFDLFEILKCIASMRSHYHRTRKSPRFTVKFNADRLRANSPSESLLCNEISTRTAAIILYTVYIFRTVQKKVVLYDLGLLCDILYPVRSLQNSDWSENNSLKIQSEFSVQTTIDTNHNSQIKIL